MKSFKNFLKEDAPTNHAFLTTTQRDAMSGLSQGAMIFNSTSKKMEFYDGTTWQSLPRMSLGRTVALDG